ncbi:MAG: DUF4150 domain-containing protein [Desulfamplus sp.]|nr:DUF4150 domain-containing protein [Desulfamplus sp.]
MFPGSTKGGGNCLAFPDVCLTPMPPPVVQTPIPYPNIAMLTQAKKTSKKVKFVNKEVVTMKSEIPKTQGDEAGVLKGTTSKTNMAKLRFKRGSSKVKVEGQPCIHLIAMSAHNGPKANAPMGVQISPSQKKVTVML